MKRGSVLTALVVVAAGALSWVAVRPGSGGQGEPGGPQPQRAEPGPSATASQGSEPALAPVGPRGASPQRSAAQPTPAPVHAEPVLADPVEAAPQRGFEDGHRPPPLERSGGTP